METMTADTQSRNFEIKLMPCLVTGQFSKCIVAKLGELKYPESDQVAEIFGQFSEEGLKTLLSDLTSAPEPIQFSTSGEIRRDNPYQWGVKYDDGMQLAQYLQDGTETNFGIVELPRVIEFWLLPKLGRPDLPTYVFAKGKGFFRKVENTWVSLDLPHPGDDPFEWHYYRRTTLHFGSFAGNTDQLPPHLVQVLGWRIGETILEIGVEEDGSWQVYRQQPYDDSRFSHEGRVIQSDEPVRIIDALEN